KTDFDVKLLVDTALGEMIHKPQDINEGIIQAIEHIGKTYGIEAYADEAVSNNIDKPSFKQVPVLYGYHPFTKSYVFDGKKLGIENVYDAAKYCKKVLKENSTSLFLKEKYHFAVNALRKKGI